MSRRVRHRNLEITVAGQDHLGRVAVMYVQGSPIHLVDLAPGAAPARDGARPVAGLLLGRVFGGYLGRALSIPEVLAAAIMR